MADLARSLPWHRISNDQYGGAHAPPIRKRRESSADSGIKSMRSRRDSHTSDITKMFIKKDVSGEKENQENITAILVIEQQPLSNRNGSRRGSGDSSSKGIVRRDSLIVPPPKIVATHNKKRRDSLAAPEIPNFRQEQRPSTSSDSGSLYASQQVDFCPMPMMMVTSVSPPATSPKFEMSKSGRRDSMTQCRITNRRESRLQRQATAYDEYNTPHTSRRGSQSQQQQPTLSPSGDGDSSTNLCERQARRDSLSPDVNTSK